MKATATFAEKVNEQIVRKDAESLMKSIDPKDTEKLKQLINDCNDKDLL